MAEFIHVVNNWSVEMAAPLGKLETHEIIPTENLIKVFLYHGGYHEEYVEDACGKDIGYRVYDTCICYVFRCPVRGTKNTWFEGYMERERTLNKFKTLVTSLCETYTPYSEAPLEFYGNFIYREKINA